MSLFNCHFFFNFIDIHSHHNRSDGKECTPVKLWDQELKRSKSFQLGKAASVKSVCRNTNKVS